MAIDRERMQAFLDRALADVGACLTSALVVVGDRLGLYRAMAAAGPTTSAELAERTGTKERPVREWLRAQAAAGYVAYDAATDRYALTEEQAAALADEASPVCMLGGFLLGISAARADESLTEAFRSGDGIPWSAHHPGVFEGTARFFRPAYANHLVRTWLPSLDGVVAKLEGGGRVADVGCGVGHSARLLSRAFPRAQVVGFDDHGPSIETAREAASREGLAETCRFEVAPAASYPGAGYDLVTFFDCLHDMGDPVGVAKHVRQSLAPDGTWMLVEPLASDRVEENLTPVGRVYYAASTLVCTPSAMSQGAGAEALGAQAGEGRLREVAEAAGFRSFRRATQTRFHMVLELRP
ncbi:MAG: methyltransferase domain-containing protein [Deltaproteobacteria bacterium]|nr:methyltransferase domain-containing protein [Deltaproteobacteria bacterium]